MSLGSLVRLPHDQLPLTCPPGCGFPEQNFPGETLGHLRPCTGRRTAPKSRAPRWWLPLPGCSQLHPSILGWSIPNWRLLNVHGSCKSPPPILCDVAVPIINSDAEAQSSSSCWVSISTPNFNFHLDFALSKLTFQIMPHFWRSGNLPTKKISSLYHCIMVTYTSTEANSASFNLRFFLFL